MELFFVTLLCLFLSTVFLSLHFLFYKNKPSLAAPLPPGKTGWPVIGESLEFLSNGWKGHPEKFIFDRMAKYSSSIFRIHLLREKVTGLFGTCGNKFLFSNENKLVQVWWPSLFDTIFPSLTQTSAKEEATKMRKTLLNILKADALHRYVGIMDHIARRHFSQGWENKEEIIVFPFANNYTFWLACQLFVSIEDPQEVDRLSVPFNLLTSAMISIPINLPGTALNKGIKTSKFIRKQLVSIVKQCKIDLDEGKYHQHKISCLTWFRPVMRMENSSMKADKILSLLMTS